MPHPDLLDLGSVEKFTSLDAGQAFHAGVGAGGKEGFDRLERQETLLDDPFECFVLSRKGNVGRSLVR
jgi:hypothetical protein